MPEFDISILNGAIVDGAGAFQGPKQHPAGVPHVLVKGRLVIDGGDHTGARPCAAIRGGGA